MNKCKDCDNIWNPDMEGYRCPVCRDNPTDFIAEEVAEFRETIHEVRARVKREREENKDVDRENFKYSQNYHFKARGQ